MIKTIAELVAMNVNSKDFIDMEGIKVIVTKGDYETFFEIDKSNTSYAMCTSVPNSLLNMIMDDNRYFNTVSNRTCTLIYYMAGYNPEMTLKELTTVDMIIGGLLND